MTNAPSDSELIANLGLNAAASVDLLELEEERGEMFTDFAEAQMEANEEKRIVLPPVPRSHGMMEKRVWPVTLTMDIALALHPLPEILMQHGMTEAQWESLSENTAFRMELAATRKEIAESGISFKRKAAVQAEDYLVIMDGLMHNPDVAPSVKRDIFLNMAELGELRPKKDKGSGAIDGAGQFNIQINIG